MILLSVMLFSIAALLGFYLLSFVWVNKNTPKGVAFTHGPLAALALIFLIIYAILHQSNLWISVCIFILASLGGVFLIYRDLTGKSLPKWMALGHGVVALLGFVVLIFLIFSH